MNSESSGRIPANKSSAYTVWELPEVRSGQVYHVEKDHPRGSRGELVNVDKNQIIYNSLTAAQLEEITNQAYDDIHQQAYEEGLAQGKKDGHRAGQKIIQSKAASLQACIEGLTNILQGQDDELEQGLVNLATCIARSVIRRELAVDSSHILAVVSDALAILPVDSDHVEIALSEQDYQLLSQHTTIPEQWKLLADATVSPGGCRVKTQHSVVDYTLEEQFQQTINHLVEDRFAELAQQAKKRDDDNSSRES